MAEVIASGAVRVERVPRVHFVLASLLFAFDALVMGQGIVSILLAAAVLLYGATIVLASVVGRSKNPRKRLLRNYRKLWIEG